MDVKTIGIPGVMNFSVGAIHDLQGAESFVSCRLSHIRKKFDKAMAKGQDLSRFTNVMVPAERAEYVREQLRFAINIFAEQSELMQEAQELVQTAADGNFKDIDRKAAQNLADRMYQSIRRVQGETK